MAAIEDIMKRTGASRRKIEKVALGMGFAQSEEYPDEVEASVAKSMQLSNGKKRARSDAHYATEVASSTSVSNPIEQDKAQVDAQAQYRAAGRIIGRNALTAFYEATEEFTIPGLKEQVERSKQCAASITNEFEELYSTDNFLSQSHLARMLPSGRSGSGRLLNSSNSQPNELDDDESIG